MLRTKKLRVLGFALGLGFLATLLSAADMAPEQERRKAAQQAQKAGNFKDAYAGFHSLVLKAKSDPALISQDYVSALICLRRLGRGEEIDSFREAAVGVHPGNWRFLSTVARSYAEDPNHFGFLVAGKFVRGNRRGGGTYATCGERDRVRALQLMYQALPLARADKDAAEVANFHFLMARILLQGAGELQPWRLQDLTDLGTLPDVTEGGAPFRRGRIGGSPQGAPVDAEGKPVLHALPASLEAAKTDGERWRWALAEVARVAPGRLSEIEMVFADFLRGQLGEETLARFGWFPRAEEDGQQDESGTYALHKLADNESIARLATGIKRFSLPEEFHPIALYRKVAARGHAPYSERARDQLATILENRRQYPRAAEAWKTAIAEYGPGTNGQRTQRLAQIVEPWGRLEAPRAQATGQKAVLDYRYRNGKKVNFEAHAVHVDKLLNDVRTHLKSNPERLDWNQVNVQNIGYRLVAQGQQQYVGAQVAAWALDLEPRRDHVDDRRQVTAPLEKPGLYLITATIQGGNTSRVLIWINDTLIVRKALDGQRLYYVADAVTGQPVPGASLELLGWKQVQVKPNTNQYRVETKEIKTTTNEEGMVVLGEDKVPTDHQWLAVARKEGRLAYLGFANIWYPRKYEEEYNATRVFTMTDRPVYRPEQTVKFKFWIRNAKYDQPDVSDFAGKPFTVLVNNPRGEAILEKTLKADEYGGLSGELPLPKGAVLGEYALMIKDHGGGNFRVEEYKKPEYEVTVEAPKEPIRLGESVEATVRAKYYFGAPVTNAKVSYKVQRSSHETNWFPEGRWDWLYGPGYWWFAADHVWYPGWRVWGCRRPMPPWFHRGNQPPEIVAENEAVLGPDGTFKVAFDTAPALGMHGDQDHEYTITAEVVDESRRTIVGTGKVLVARKPFKVFSWVDRGHYRAGDTVHASFKGQTPDGKPVEGEGELTLLKIRYQGGEPTETPVQRWKVSTDAEGYARQQLTAAEPGQYRLSYRLVDKKKNAIEGGYLFVVAGAGFQDRDFRFNDLELVTDQKEYAPGDKVRLRVNTNRADSTVLLFLRASNGVAPAPRLVHLKGKSLEEEILVAQRDMPNFHIEALTVSGGQVHTEVREVVVPPARRVLNVTVLPSQQEYKPGEKATVKIRVTDSEGKPFVGSTVVSMYDRSVDAIAGGTNVPEIRAFFWQWRRHHQPQTESSLHPNYGELLRRGETGMRRLGLFGDGVIEEMADGSGGMAFGRGRPGGFGGGLGGLAGGGPGGPMLMKSEPASGRPMAEAAAGLRMADSETRRKADEDPGAGVGPEPVVRRNFADTAYWNAALTTDDSGVAEFTLPMPENLTGWKIKTWAMGHGTRVGEGATVVTTKKDLLVRLQAPRFFVQKDEVVLSANVHNYLKGPKQVRVALEMEGGTLAALGEVVKTIEVASGADVRVDWRVRALTEGSAVVRVKAVTDVDADAMEMRFPVFVHGMLRMEAFSGVVRPDRDVSKVEFTVPAERRVAETRLEVRYSPSLAGAMVDALPYLVDYPYGCTEQTLNRFLPTVIAQRILQRMNINLKDVRDKRTNLNAQEIGDDKARAQGWKRWARNPVFDEAEVKKMVEDGIQALMGMQCSDGGWGWFSGSGEHSSPHTTAVVVHGLQVARENDGVVPPGVIERGVAWLKAYQTSELAKIRNAPAQAIPFKEHADNVDALSYMILCDAGMDSDEMRDMLYRDRNHLSVYAKALFGLALAKQTQAEKLAMILRNIDQFLVQDEENQTAYLRLPENHSWWFWYGDEMEANANYLKLLARVNPRDQKASRLVKYLLNNRKHATYWKSTRDTAVCVEALAEYMRATGEDLPDMTVEIWLDGKLHKESRIEARNLFTFDNAFVLQGEAVTSGAHVLEVRRKGSGPVYFNTYVTNFTQEDRIPKAGLEVRVQRKIYKLTRDDASVKTSGARGEVVSQKVEKYTRTELSNLATLKSGDLVEVELEIDSKNDYEYVAFEDPKAAGFEPVSLRSGYVPNSIGAYMELRDDRVTFFARQLARGKHSLSYRLRAEIPGTFSALPTIGYAMYAPELKGNSDEIRLSIVDQ